MKKGKKGSEGKGKRLDEEEGRKGRLDALAAGASAGVAAGAAVGVPAGLQGIAIGAAIGAAAGAIAAEVAVEVAEAGNRKRKDRKRDEDSLQ